MCKIGVWCKDCWCIALGQEEVFLCEGGGKNLKRGWNRKDGRYKIFKKGGKLGQEVGASKRMGWNTLTNYA